MTGAEILAMALDIFAEFQLYIGVGLAMLLGGALAARFLPKGR